MTAVVKAIEQKRFKQAKLLQLGDDVNQRDKLTGRTPLLAVCFVEDETLACCITKALLHRGANVGITDTNGINPLMQASRLGKERLAAVLIGSKECDLVATDNNGNTALMHSIESGNPCVTKALLEAMNAYNVRAADKANCKGETPLIRATKLQQDECKELLLKDGKASPYARDFDERRNAAEWETYMIGWKKRDLKNGEKSVSKMRIVSAFTKRESGASSMSPSPLMDKLAAQPSDIDTVRALPSCTNIFLRRRTKSANLEESKEPIDVSRSETSAFFEGERTAIRVNTCWVPRKESVNFPDNECPSNGQVSLLWPNRKTDGCEMILRGSMIAGLPSETALSPESHSINVSVLDLKGKNVRVKSAPSRYSTSKQANEILVRPGTVHFEACQDREVEVGKVKEHAAKKSLSRAQSASTTQQPLTYLGDPVLASLVPENLLNQTPSKVMRSSSNCSKELPQVFTMLAEQQTHSFRSPAKKNLSSKLRSHEGKLNDVGSSGKWNSGKGSRRRSNAEVALLAYSKFRRGYSRSHSNTLKSTKSVSFENPDSKSRRGSVQSYGKESTGDGQGSAKELGCSLVSSTFVDLNLGLSNSLPGRSG